MIDLSDYQKYLSGQYIRHSNSISELYVIPRQTYVVDIGGTSATVE